MRQSMDRQVTVMKNDIFDEASVRYANSQLLRYVADEYIKDVRRNRRSIEDFFLALRKLSNHDAKSLLYVKNFLESKSWENITFDSDDYKNLLIDYLRNHKAPMQEYNDLIYYKIENHLPEDYLGWFKNDLRSSIFLASLVKESLEREAFKGRSELIAEISDYLRYDIHMFNSYYSEYLPDYERIDFRRGEWRTVHILSVKSIYLKSRTDEKDMKWLIISNKEQIEWAYSYLDNIKRPYIILKDVFFPDTIRDKYDLILASLDRLSNKKNSDVRCLELASSFKTNPKDVDTRSKGNTERDHVIKNMKKAWETLKHDSSNSKAKLVLTISDKNRKRLHALAKNAKQTPNKFINSAIEDTYNQILGSDE